MPVTNVIFNFYNLLDFDLKFKGKKTSHFTLPAYPSPPSLITNKKPESFEVNIANIPASFFIELTYEPKGGGKNIFSATCSTSKAVAARNTDDDFIIGGGVTGGPYNAIANKRVSGNKLIINIEFKEWLMCCWWCKQNSIMLDKG